MLSLVHSFQQEAWTPACAGVTGVQRIRIKIFIAMHHVVLIACIVVVPAIAGIES